MSENVNQNPSIHIKEAISLKYPRLMEVWTTGRNGRLDVIISVGPHGGFSAASGAIYWNAAHPSKQVIESLKHQIVPESEFPKPMLVWHFPNDEDKASEALVLHDFGPRVLDFRYIAVAESYRKIYETGGSFGIRAWSHAKPIPEPDPVQEKRQELLAEALRLETIAKTIREQAENL
jgi:hypothetical protein